MTRRPRSGFIWLTGAALVIALIAGCTQPQKSGTAKSPTAQAQQKAPAPQPGAPATAKPAKPADKKATSAKPSASAADPSAGVADATKKEGCCPGDAKEADAKTPGATAIDLNPPPPDQPQPKLVCKQTKIVNEPVWQGKEGVFTFTISNEGKAPLAIRVKPT